MKKLGMPLLLLPKPSNRLTCQKKTQLDRILLRPDAYIGSRQYRAYYNTQLAFVYDTSTGRIVQRDVTFTPGFYKMYHEIIVNAADNKQRDPPGMDGPIRCQCRCKTGYVMCNE